MVRIDELRYDGVRHDEIPPSDFLRRDCAAASLIVAVDWEQRAGGLKFRHGPTVVAAARLAAVHRHRRHRRSRHRSAVAAMGTLVFRRPGLHRADGSQAAARTGAVRNGAARIGADAHRVAVRDEFARGWLGHGCFDHDGAHRCAGGRDPQRGVSLTGGEAFPSGWASRWDDVGANLLSSCLKLSGSKGFVNFRTVRNALIVTTCAELRDRNFPQGFATWPAFLPVAAEFAESAIMLH